MKILICGVGSIGERHISNLLKLGYKDIILFRQRQSPLRTIENIFPVFTSLSEALSECPDVAFVCNPTHLHAKTIIQCVEVDCHIFVEKPLCHTLDDCLTIYNAVRKKKVQLMVGYMMRFHPCLLKIQEWVMAERFGKLLHFRSQWGEYLPDWHPWEDYRKTYAALDSMGGGAALTLSHELDTLLWLAGNYEIVSAQFNYASDLQLSTEHGVDFLVRMQSGVTANIHLDYFQSPPSRTMELVGSFGRVFFDYFESRVELFEKGIKEAIEVFDISNTFDRNDLFVSEVEYFLNGLKNGVEVIPGVKEGCDVVRLVVEAKEHGNG